MSQNVSNEPLSIPIYTYSDKIINYEQSIDWS